MSELPKLKIKKHFGGYPLEEKICEFEQAQNFLSNYWASVIVAVEGQVTRSYEELVQLATKDCYKDKEFLEVGLYPTAGGG